MPSEMGLKVQTGIADPITTASRMENTRRFWKGWSNLKPNSRAAKVGLGVKSAVVPALRHAFYRADLVGLDWGLWPRTARIEITV